MRGREDQSKQFCTSCVNWVESRFSLWNPTQKPFIPETATSCYFLASCIGSASLMIIWEVKANIYTLAFSLDSQDRGPVSPALPSGITESSPWGISWPNSCLMFLVNAHSVIVSVVGRRIYGLCKYIPTLHSLCTPRQLFP